MKTVQLILISILGIILTSNAQNTSALKTNASIQLVLKNSPKQTFNIRSVTSNRTYNQIDSVIIGNKPDADTLYYELYVTPLEEKQFQLGFTKKKLNFVALLQAGDHLKVDADFNNVNTIVYSGSARTHEYREFMETKKRIEGDSLLSYRMARKARRSDSAMLKHKIDSIEKLSGTYIREKLFSTQSPYLAIWALMGAQNGIANFTKEEYNELRNRFRNDKFALMQIDINQNVQEHPIGQKPKPADNTLLAGFTLPNASGKPISLQDFKGKYVLVDFWASWCGPCRKESPYLKQAIQKFGGQNFVILSVSIDERTNAWKTAIATDGTQQFVHVIDTRGWKSPVIKQYNIESIPSNFLLDPTGKIISKDLKGKEVLSKIENVLLPKSN